ncbi:MAG: hypothetical protein D3923_18280, partial [Candidatus Electrothrix sp. AR3]|nr:hypothetical protein [Candidatus Electrothrix sp. AR3]
MASISKKRCTEFFRKIIFLPPSCFFSIPCTVPHDYYIEQHIILCLYTDLLPKKLNEIIIAMKRTDPVIKFYTKHLPDAELKHNVLTARCPFCEQYAKNNKTKH